MTTFDGYSVLKQTDNTLEVSYLYFGESEDSTITQVPASIPIEYAQMHRDTPMKPHMVSLYDGRATLLCER